MTNEQTATVTPIAEAPTSLRWCRNGIHRIAAHMDRCNPCLRQSNYRSIARNTGAKFCPAGHGMVRGNLGPGGACVECVAFDALIADPDTPVRPAPPTWLDWAAVLQALNGEPLVRPLSTRELACVITTIQSRREEPVTWREVSDWLAASTHVVGVTAQYAIYVMTVWAVRNGYPDPRITLEQAVFAEADGDAWIHQARRARQTEAELAEIA